VTLDTPAISPVYNTPLFLSVPISAVVPAADEATLIAQTWKNFQTLKITTKHIKDMDSGKPLTYYSDWAATATTATSLLEKLDGQCSAFTDLFMMALKEAGVRTTPLKEERVLPITFNERMLIKNWSFAGDGSSGDMKYPFVNTLTDPTKNPADYPNGIGCYSFFYLVAGYTYSWGAVSEVTDQNGVNGQNTSNPKADFGVHFLVSINGRFYDPSYGADYATLRDWKNASVAGFAIPAQVPNSPGNYRLIIRRTLATDDDVKLFQGP
jgi:hypothetical protein